MSTKARAALLASVCSLGACQGQETAPSADANAGPFDASQVVVPDLARAGDACRPDWTEAYDCFDNVTPEQAGVGACEPGQRYCVDEVWTECLEQPVPRAEACNRIDDSCNGEVDEHRNACGRCEAVSMIRDCFGANCERAFDIGGTGLTCDDGCCDCVRFAPGSSDSVTITFDVCDLHPDVCTSDLEGFFGSVEVSGELDGLLFEGRQSLVRSEIGAEAFEPRVLTSQNGSSVVSISGAYLELRVSLSPEATEPATLCSARAGEVGFHLD